MYHFNNMPRDFTPGNDPHDDIPIILLQSVKRT
jgi:hypothetical protein